MAEDEERENALTEFRNFTALGVACCYPASSDYIESFKASEETRRQLEKWGVTNA